MTHTVTTHHERRANVPAIRGAMAVTGHSVRSLALASGWPHGTLSSLLTERITGERMDDARWTRLAEALETSMDAITWSRRVAHDGRTPAKPRPS